MVTSRAKQMDELYERKEIMRKVHQRQASVDEDYEANDLLLGAIKAKLAVLDEFN